MRSFLGLRDITPDSHFLYSIQRNMAQPFHAFGLIPPLASWFDAQDHGSWG
jgi:hypothetical protein